MVLTKIFSGFEDTHLNQNNDCFYGKICTFARFCRSGGVPDASFRQQ